MLRHCRWKSGSAGAAATCASTFATMARVSRKPFSNRAAGAVPPPRTRQRRRPDADAYRHRAVGRQPDPAQSRRGRRPRPHRTSTGRLMNELTLVIDDDPSFNAILVRTLERRGHPAQGALNPSDALAAASQTLAGRVVLDLNLNGSSGLALIPLLLAINPDCRIVVLTGYASIATAVDAVKLGAIQYLAKPVEIEAILAAFED